jgi:Sec-independent protein translocase protein TatA
VGFGAEIFFFMALGVIVLGPKRLQALIGHVARAKVRFEETTHALKSQLAEELDDKHSERPKSSPELSEDD